MIVYTGGHADGNAHSHTNLPVILAGTAGGRLQAGRFHKVVGDADVDTCTSTCSTHGNRRVDRFGDSTGRAKI